MLPTDERDLLFSTVLDATDWAKAGYPSVGYDVLLLGRRHAEQVRARGVAWGEELVNGYNWQITRPGRSLIGNGP